MKEPPEHVSPPRFLYPLVFLAGIGSMAAEMCASRLLAPFYGSSTVVWANIIGLVLAALSVGYWLGGRIADKHPAPRLLSLLVVAAALWVAAIPFAAQPFLRLSVRGIESLSTGTVIGSFAAALALFAPPVVVLGTVTPFAIRLATSGVSDAGRVAGRVFALSTAGSLVGTFGPALLTIPLIGTQRTLLLAAAILALAAAPLLARRAAIGFAVAALLLAALALPTGTVKNEPGLLFETESTYQFIHVVERSGERGLYLNEGIAVHSVYRPETVLTGGYWDTYLVAPALLGRAPRHIAILGNAGGTTARALGVYYPEAAVDGVEIDPAVSAAGQRYFGMNDNPRLTVHDADARPFLRTTETRYDLIFVDAYRQPYVPFYMATREFFALCRQRLAPGGMVVLNVSTVPGDKRLAETVAGTLATQFPQVRTWQPLRFNQIVVGFNAPTDEAQLRARAARAPSDLRRLALMAADNFVAAAPSAHPWTDDRAPVEWLTDRMFASYAVRGSQDGDISLPVGPTEPNGGN